MKNTLLLLFVFMLSIVAKSQEITSYNELEYKILKENKKSIVKQSIVITNEDAEFFWPLYEEYNSKMNKLNDKYIGLLRKYSDNQGELNFDQTMDLWEEIMDVKQDLLKLDKKYYWKMIDVMSPVKVVTYFNLEREIKAKVEMEFLGQKTGTIASLD